MTDNADLTPRLRAFRSRCYGDEGVLLDAAADELERLRYKHDKLVIEVADLRAAAQQARAALRTCLAALETCTPADYSTGHVIHADYDAKMCSAAEGEAPAALRALDEALKETP